MGRKVDELLEGALAGLTGTAVMSAGYAAEHRLRRSVDGPLDYDDSDSPAVAAAQVLTWLRILDGPPSPAVSQALGFLVKWGYGSLVGVVGAPLTRRFGPWKASVIYGGGITVMAGVLFPLLGGTPPPWRWRRDILATSIVQHLVYAAAVVGVAEAEKRDDEAEESEEVSGGDRPAR